MYLSNCDTNVDALRAITDAVEKQLSNMQAKADEVFPKVQQLVKFPSKYDYKVDNIATIEHSEHWWDYKGCWGAATPLTSLDGLTKRKDALLVKVDEWTAACAIVEAQNKSAIDNNLVIHNKVKQIMTQLGIPDHYYEKDTKSRARYPKNIERRAGYIDDLSRNVPITQWSSYKSDAQTLKQRIEESYLVAYKKLFDEQNKADKEKAKKDNEAKVAYYKVKYKCDPVADIRSVLDEILLKDKYLRLAHWLQKNREDWSDGYDYAEIGIDGFAYESDLDSDIIECINEILAKEDIDGRYFRDCEYNYNVLFGMADETLLKDYEEVKKLVEGE